MKNQTKFDWLQENPMGTNLLEFAKILSHQNDYHEILRLVAHKATLLFDADLTLVLMLNPDTRETVKTIFKEGKRVEKREYLPIHIHVGGWVIKNQKSFVSTDIQHDPRFVADLFDEAPVQAVLGIPLIVEGIIIGSLLLLYKQRREPVERSEVLFAESFAAVVAPFLRNVQKIRQYFASTIPESVLTEKYARLGLLGKSKRFVELLHAIEAAARCDVRVLLEGKTGTGKELIARAIHQFSSRCHAPLVAIDCGAIPQNLIESELFGHKKGAFTGAMTERKGLLAEADGGTLFMDEIANLPLEMQSKLLRVLEAGEVRPIGSNRSMHVDVRIIAACSEPLKKLVEAKAFREDLYFRLHVYPIAVPDLSERRKDITLLANHFLATFAERQHKNARAFHAEILDFLKMRQWPGNIRELENIVERLVTLTPPNKQLLEVAYLPADLREELDQFRAARDLPGSRSLSEQMQSFEAEIIKQTLLKCDWNQSQAARKLRTSEKNIRYKMNKLKINRPVE